LEEKKIPSLILWGPPGSEKTMLARLLAKEVGLTFEAVSATSDGVGDLRNLAYQPD
jgi:putative ATPase